jgi:predicted DNA-binding ribbon-helix-helix protein
MSPSRRVALPGTRTRTRNSVTLMLFGVRYQTYTCYCRRMLGHRFQILLDDERYERVTALARDRKVSVATVIREAIDRGLPAPQRRREAAALRILAAEPMPTPEPAELRAELDEARGRHE